jgi:hypothetical protein
MCLIKHSAFFQLKKLKMAKQKGIVPIQGTIDNITFFKTKDGYRVRKKTEMPAGRIANDPAFQRTRENGAEFGRAGKAGKNLRSAFGPLLQKVSDSRMISRLVSEMTKVIKADKASPRGFRNVIDGEAELLKGFEFNANSTLESTLSVQVTKSIDRVTGELTIAIPSFIPAKSVAIPQGATHFRLVASGAEVDFETGNYVADVKTTAELPWNNNATAAINLVNHVTPNSTKPLFLVLGIEFFQLVNGNMYSLTNGAFNALSLVEVSGG